VDAIPLDMSGTLSDLSQTVQEHSTEQNAFSEADACSATKEVTLITINGKDTFLCLYNFLELLYRNESRIKWQTFFTF
jgi:hypothetical protein